MKIKVLHTFEECPSNPARCHVPSGTIEINNTIWQLLTPEDREFVLQHEIGHFQQQTYDELKADDYALNKLALRKPNSLWNFYKSVRNISKNNPARIRNARYKVLSIAADNGSQEARELLKHEYAHADGNNSTTPNGKKYIVIGLLAIVLAALIIYKLKH